MAKRFTDTAKWNKVWFRKLSLIHKCFWEYLTDNCDHAGVWEVDFETASYYIGEDLDINDIKKTFDKQIIEVDCGKRWFIRDFIVFQYNCNIKELNPANKLHNSIIQILKKYEIIGAYKGLVRGMQGDLQGHMDKDKDKDKDMDKDKDFLLPFEKPVLEKVKTFFESAGYEITEAEKFWSHYDSIGWETVRGQPIKYWTSKVLGWMNNSKQYGQNNGKTKNINNPGSFREGGGRSGFTIISDGGNESSGGGKTTKDFSG